MAARDYKNLKRPTLERKKKEPASGVAPMAAFLSGLGLGLLVALGVYVVTPGRDVGDRTEARDQRATARENTHPATARQETQARYDFYSILTERDVSISEWETETEDDEYANGDGHDQQASAEVAQAASPSKELLILQIGSFLSLAAANQMKTQLADTGIQSNIQRVVINGQDVRYRVRTSPYEDKSKLQVTRQQLLDNNIEHVLLTLRAQQHEENR